MKMTILVLIVMIINKKGMLVLQGLYAPINLERRRSGIGVLAHMYSLFQKHVCLAWEQFGAIVVEIAATS